MVITATKLRQNVYKIIDEVITTGKPVTIRRGNEEVKISTVPKRKKPLKKKNKLDNIKPRGGILNCDPEEIVHMDWSKEVNLDFP